MLKEVFEVSALGLPLQPPLCQRLYLRQCLCGCCCGLLGADLFLLDVGLPLHWSVRASPANTGTSTRRGCVGATGGDGNTSRCGPYTEPKHALRDPAVRRSTAIRTSLVVTGYRGHTLLSLEALYCTHNVPHLSTNVREPV